MAADPSIFKSSPFFIDMPTGILTLEKNSLLDGDFSESSPLRRSVSAQQKYNNLELKWDSRDIDLAALSTEEVKYVYVARVGKTFNGHIMVEKILSSGQIFIGEIKAVYKFLHSQNRPDEWIHSIVSHPFFIPVIDVEKALYSLLKLSCHFSSLHLTSVAVTGTNGKTSVTEIIRQLLNILTKKPTISIGTLGIKIGDENYSNTYPTMPDYPTFLSVCSYAHKKEISQIVFEATSQGLHQNRNGDWKNNVAVFTNLSLDHIDYHKTLDAYRQAKGILFEKNLSPTGAVILNVDDENWSYFAEKGKSPQRRCIGYGSEKHLNSFLKQQSENYMSVSYLSTTQKISTLNGIHGVWRYSFSKNQHLETAFQCKLIGSFQIDNITAAAAVMLALGHPLEEISKNIAHVKPIPGRLELVNFRGVSSNPSRTHNLPTVIVDYAHSPDALEKALMTCRKSLAPEGKLLVTFGCGGERDVSKRPIMGKIAQSLADMCIVTSDNPRNEDPQKIIDDIKCGMNKTENTVYQPDRALAIEMAISCASENDIVLIAGKGHEKYQIIGTQQFPFSDVSVAGSCLAKLYAIKKQ